MTHPSPAAIALKAVRFTWPGDTQPVLDIRELTVLRGERVFIRGPSGSGKTTLLNLIGAVITPDTGQIEVDQIDLNQLVGGARDRFRADRIGFVFQQFNLLPFLSVVDNVLLPCRFSTTRRTQAVSSGGSLQGEAQRLLDALGIPESVRDGRDTSRLSVGQQQRVAVARALVGRPPIVIADEPTSALDTDTRDAFLELLMQETTAVGATLLFVSHDRGLAAAFDRTLDLDALATASGGCPGVDRSEATHHGGPRPATGAN